MILDIGYSVIIVFIYLLFIYCLFNDAVSSPGHVVPNDRMISE
jgi:hypothetical protein